MAVFKTYEEIEKALERFNKRAYNAGLDFRVDSFEEHYINIQASFDFLNYINVQIDFDNVIYTNINSNQYWTDAWDDDQMMLLSQEELDEVIDFKDIIKLNEGKQYFGIVFNIEGFVNYYTSGLIIAEVMRINWIYPKYDD